jgi:hypothetical protein
MTESEKNNFNAQLRRTLRYGSPSEALEGLRIARTYQTLFFVGFFQERFPKSVARIENDPKIITMLRAEHKQGRARGAKVGPKLRLNTAALLAAGVAGARQDVGRPEVTTDIRNRNAVLANRYQLLLKSKLH